MKKLPNGIYRHYKGNVYRVICVAKHSETLEDMVVYTDMVDSEKNWVRPLSMWNEKVTIGGEIKPRFEFIAANAEDMDDKINNHNA